MATDTTPSLAAPLLVTGQRMDRVTFHALYEQTPEGFKAELIGGVVYVACPLKVPHGRQHGILMGWIGTYCAETPGTDVLDNTTDILGDDSEPQPDAALRLEGGTSFIDEHEFLTGPPEFVAEVSDSTLRLDLHAKRADYQRHGVAEYWVLDVRAQRAVWFVRDQAGQFVEQATDADGLLRSRVFPGLWLDAAAFFRRDRRAVLAALRAGLESAEHAAFAAERAE